MFFEEMKIGMHADLDPVEIKKDDMVAFAQKYDNLPLHTDEQYAASTPFGALIASGLMSFATVWPQYLKKDFVGDALIAGKSTKIEWLAPVYAGDVLSGQAYISNLTERSGKNGIAEITLNIFNQNGVKVISNVTQAVVKKSK